MEDVILEMDKLKSYVERLERMFGEDFEKLYKKFHSPGEDLFSDGYRGLTGEDFNFLCWLIGDVRKSVKKVCGYVEAMEEQKLQKERTDTPPRLPVIPMDLDNRPPLAMLSGLIPQLSILLAFHGDMVVQVEGQDLAWVQPAIWTQKEQATAGGGLRNCLFLGGCNG